MSKITLCAILLAVVSVGCSYDMGERQIVVDRVFESEPQLVLSDITDVMARKNTVAIKVQRSYGADATYRESLQPVREVVPYHFGREMGNFCSGVISTVMIPISLPVFAMSGMPARDYWKHLGITAHNLNFLQAGPDDPAVAFRTPAEQRPTGEIFLSEIKTLNETYTAPLVNGQVAIEILALASGKTATLTAATNAKGELVIDLGALADKLALPAGERVVALKVTVRHGGGSATIELTAHTER